MKIISDAASAVAYRRQQLSHIEYRLRLVNERIDNKLQWVVELTLDKGNGYNQTTVDFTIPMGMVQQKLIDDLRAARCALTLAEYEFAKLTGGLPK